VCFESLFAEMIVDFKNGNNYCIGVIPDYTLCIGYVILVRVRDQDKVAADLVNLNVRGKGISTDKGVGEQSFPR
jgi:hypothetical protein